MKIRILLGFIFLASMSISAQNYTKQIEAFKESFKNKNSKKLQSHLSSGFSLPSITNKVQIPIGLDQLFTQLPYISLEVKEHIKNKVLVTYNFEQLGERTSAVHFNDKGEITKIELFDNLINQSIERRNAKPVPDKILAKKYPAKKVTFKTTDDRIVYGELYEAGKDNPVILLCHQSGFNKFEYVDIAPKLNELGFNCLAVDLTTGGTFQGNKNETIDKAKVAIDRSSMVFVDASEEEIIAAISFLNEKYKKKVTIWGSSSSATLGIFAASKNENVNAAIAFSAFDHFRENRISLAVLIPKIDKPLFMTSAKVEASIITELLKDVQLKNNQIHFIPKGPGDHGSKAMWNERPDAEEYWIAIKSFLNVIK